MAQATASQTAHSSTFISKDYCRMYEEILLPSIGSLMYDIFPNSISGNELHASLILHSGCLQKHLWDSVNNHPSSPHSRPHDSGSVGIDSTSVYFWKSVGDLSVLPGLRTTESALQCISYIYKRFIKTSHCWGKWSCLILLWKFS